MNLEKLSRIDLNLLLCLNVLLEECNVTRAANRLCLSQSAVSKSLAKLMSTFRRPIIYSPCAWSGAYTTGIAAQT